MTVPSPVRRLLLASCGLGAALLAWGLAAASGRFNPILLPTPAGVLRAAAELLADGTLLPAVAASLGRVAGGFLLSVAVATPLGFLFGANELARRAVAPIFLVLKPIPPIAWIPLAILWFGLGNGPACFLTMVASFFPILLSAAAGAENAGQRHLDVARSFGAGRRLVLTSVILPAALPHLLTGYRVGFGVAWMAVVAAELVAAQSGLGYLIHLSQDMLRTDRAMAGMAVIGAVGLSFELLFLRLDRRLLPWARR
jgi:ABC-type nitrate/sulfonate/bicarbonate transport system permease component